MTHIRLGVIGAGLIWIREHQRTLAQLSDVFTPVAFCELSAERRAALQRDFPAAAIFEQQEHLLAQPDIDAVLVLTPIALNAPTATAALLAGKDVIMEKPIARSVAEAQALIDTARRVGRRLYVAEQLAYRPAEDTISALIASGEIGDVVLWEYIQHWSQNPDPERGALRYDSTPWRKNAEFPLGVMFDGGIHLIAALSTLFGQPATVTANGRKLREGYGEYRPGGRVYALSQRANRHAQLLAVDAAHAEPLSHSWHAGHSRGGTRAGDRAARRPARPRGADCAGRRPHAAVARHRARVCRRC